MSAFRIDATGYTLRRLPSSTWHVTNPTGTAYLVDVEEGRCDCPDSRTRGHRRSCKHVRAIRGLLKLVPALSEGRP